MPLPFIPPVPTADDWIAHELAVRRCRGSVCFAAIAAHFGSTSPGVLDWRIDRRKPYLTGNGDKSGSGKYRAWYRDGVRPGDATVDHISDRSKGAVDLRRWRDLMLWKLLEPEPPAIECLQRFKESAPAQIRKLLFYESEPARYGHFMHTDIGRERTLALRNLRSLDAFLILLCLAREGEVHSYDPRHALPAVCAFDVLPRVLYTHAALRYRWEALYTCLERVFWRRLHGGCVLYDFSIDRIRSNLSLLQAEPLATLDMLSWRPPQAEADAPEPTSHYKEAKRYFEQAWQAAEEEDLTWD